MHPPVVTPDTPSVHPRVERQAATLEFMIREYCRLRHAATPKDFPGLCPSCRDLCDYARTRVTRCRYGPRKGPCSRCPRPCYASAYRNAIKKVMRTMGPRMLYKMPLAFLGHVFTRTRP